MSLREKWVLALLDGMKSGSFQRVIVIKQKTQLFLLLKIIGNKKHLLSSYSVSGIIGTLKTSLYLSSEQHTTILSTIRKMLCILKVPSSFLVSEGKKKLILDVMLPPILRSLLVSYCCMTVCHNLRNLNNAYLLSHSFWVSFLSMT